MTAPLRVLEPGEIGVLAAVGRTGLRKNQIRYVADRGHLGEVHRIHGKRRFTARQVALLQRIRSLLQLGLLLPEAAALANHESIGGNVDLPRLSHVARDTAASIQRSLDGWLFLCELIDRQIGSDAAAGAAPPPVRIA